MKNTSKKLLLSVFVLLFAVVAVATTSFAWFTVSGKARVEPFDLNVTIGTGLQIRVMASGETDAATSTWKNVITTEDIASAYGATAFTALKLDHVTTTDVVNFKTLEYVADPTLLEPALTGPGRYLPVADASSGWFEITFQVRGTENYEIVLSSETDVDSDVVATYTTTDGIVVPAVDPVNASRVAFVKADNTFNIWEPIDTETPNLGGYADATTSVDANAFKYFNEYMRTVNDEEITDPHVYIDPADAAPAPTVFHDSDFAATTIVQLANTGVDTIVSAEYPFAAVVTVRIWLEGWDADCLNQLFQKKLSTILAFEIKGSDAAI